jgi:hypothetical protein
MGRLFGILLVVLGLWIGLTIYTEGTDRAFGGILRKFDPAHAPVPATRRPLERVRDKVVKARDRQESRFEGQFSETERERR